MVKRWNPKLYDPRNGITPYPVMDEAQYGRWVSLEDYEALQKKQAQPTEEKVPTLDAILEVINKPDDLMWPSSQDYLCDKIRALFSPQKTRICLKCGAPQDVACALSIRSECGREPQKQP